mmetsp:Transcript_15691/g.23083  ORF Transcript_15691/g.23083 Transcript_15691/m.23083 type:complete len:157 (+) Transcript_15691:164-634(+)
MRNWDKRVAELRLYLVENKDTRVPQSYKKIKGLGRWVHTMKGKGKGSLTEEQLSSLEEMGFDWERNKDKLDRMWDEMYGRPRSSSLSTVTATCLRSGHAIFSWEIGSATRERSFGMRKTQSVVVANNSSTKLVSSGGYWHQVTTLGTKVQSLTKSG